jgi:hypothetical protein
MADDTKDQTKIPEVQGSSTPNPRESTICADLHDVGICNALPYDAAPTMDEVRPERHLGIRTRTLDALRS